MSSYNHERFLRESIESVLNQTYSNFELIILDDASTDSSWEIIESFQDPRVIALRNNTNRERRFNQIIPGLKGEFIAVHHSDDAWEPEKLQKQVDYLDANPNTGAVFSLVTVVDSDGQPRLDGTHHYSRTFELENRSRFDWLRYFFFNGNGLCHPSVLIRKECYEVCGLYLPGLVQLPDFDMWVRLCLRYEIHVLQERLVRFRGLDDLTNSSSPRMENQIRLQFEYLQVYKNYLHLTNSGEFLQVFPEAVKYQDQDWFEPAYALAMMAMENSNIKPGQLFGLQLLFDLQNDPIKSEALKRHLGFDLNAYKKIAGEADVFYYRTQAELTATRDELARCQQQVQFYSQSRSWKLTAPLRKVVAWLSRSEYEE